ncbi:MAG: hypothetical protein NVS2B16_19890 [Chloroflexota bacterium]
MVTSNFMAVVMSTPILLAIGVLAFGARSFGLIPLGIVLFIGVLPNPLSVGVHVAARELADGYVVTPGEYFSAFREYGLLALKAWALAVVVTIVIVLNVLFYFGRASSGDHSPFFVLAGMLWLYLLFIWIGLHLYVFPLILRHEDRRILTIYRNAALMAASRVVFTTAAVLMWLLVLGVSAGSGLVTIIGLSLGAAIQQNAFARQLPTFKTM